jgi:hypothetical protein
MPSSQYSPHYDNRIDGDHGVDKPNMMTKLYQSSLIDYSQSILDSSGWLCLGFRVYLCSCLGRPILHLRRACEAYLSLSGESHILN